MIHGYCEVGIPIAEQEWVRGHVMDTITFYKAANAFDVIFRILGVEVQNTGRRMTGGEGSASTVFARAQLSVSLSLQF